MESEVNVIALVKGDQRYMFLFDDSNRDETLRTLARFAANPELDFSWYDAAMLSRKIRETLAEPFPQPTPTRIQSSLRDQS